MNPIRVSFRTTQMVRPLLPVTGCHQAGCTKSRRGQKSCELGNPRAANFRPRLPQYCLARDISRRFWNASQMESRKTVTKVFLYVQNEKKIFVCSSNRKLLKARLYFAMTKNQWLTGFLGSWLLANCGLNPWFVQCNRIGKIYWKKSPPDYVSKNYELLG